MLLLAGYSDSLERLKSSMALIPVDQTVLAPDGWQPPQFHTTLAKPFDISGPATYHKGNTRSLRFEPTQEIGWWIDRTDKPEQLPVQVHVRNVWTAQRNIVLRAGYPGNYLRMSEHIIAQRLGLGLDNVLIKTDSGDPPLFNVGSMPIVDAINNAGLVELKDRPLDYWTVSEPVAFIGPNDNSFLIFEPPEPGSKTLSLDVAIDFPTAIGKQRIQFDLTPEAFTHGAHARTNCSRKQMTLIRYFGWMFADTRHFGYNRDNILIAGTRGYYNEPALIHNGKSLEAVWHRACLDLIAALSLINSGRLAGKITSYKAGHTLDCRFMTLLHIKNLLVKLP